MKNSHKVRQGALAVVLAVASLGTAHATYPGENGDIVFGVYKFDFNNPTRLIKKVRPGSGIPPVVLATGVYPAVSPNGKKIAYSSGMAASQQERLYVMNMNGSNAVDVGPGSMPTWSPDGTKLAYLDLFPAAGNVKGIYINALNGQPSTLLAPMDVRQGTDVLQNSRMSWSPTGNLILVYAYSLSVGGMVQYVVNASDGTVTPYSSNPAGPIQATLTPDGSLMLASYRNPDCISTSFLFFSATTPVFCNGSADAYSSYAPTLSPDGSTVAWFNFNYPANNLKSAAVQGTTSQVVASDENIMSFDWARVPRTTVNTTLAGTWSPPIEMPADNYSLQTAVATMPDNGSMGQVLKQMVSINADGRVYHRTLNMANNWAPFTVVPGIGGSSAGITAKRVAISGAMDGSAQVVIVGSDDLVYHAMRSVYGQWSGFSPVSGYNGAPNFAARDVAIAVGDSSYSSPGWAQVTANGLVGGSVYHRVRWSDGSWTPFALVAGVANTLRLALSTAPNGDAYLLATTDLNQGIYRQMRRADGSWSSWVNVSSSPVGLRDVSLTIGLNASGQQVAKMAYIATDGTVSYQERPNASQSSAWVNPVQPTTLTTVSPGRTVSIANTATGADLVVVQAQPQ